MASIIFSMLEIALSMISVGIQSKALKTVPSNDSFVMFSHIASFF